MKAFEGIRIRGTFQQRYLSPAFRRGKKFDTLPLRQAISLS